ncbi:MAG: UvrB/UvrC motif-containing protein [Akkermansiaceae bacterium]|nr:UvrB/UvrC motif-containing protein [Akkermansiaceae bacterium]
MQCDYCDSKATVFFTQIIDGNSNKTCLCEACAAKHGVTDPEGFLLGNMDASHDDAKPAPKAPKFNVPMGNETIELPLTSAHPTNKAVCPGCGFAFDDLKKTGRLGCSQCYQFFRDAIKNNLVGMHKGTCHTGRVPEGMLEAFEKRQRLEQLQLEMNEAIDAEDYETAAALRDEIQNLSKETSLAPEA